MVKGNKKGLRQTGSVAIQIQIFDETRSPWFSKTSLGLTSIAKDFWVQPFQVPHPTGWVTEAQKNHVAQLRRQCRPLVQHCCTNESLGQNVLFYVFFVCVWWWGGSQPPSSYVQTMTQNPKRHYDGCWEDINRSIWTTGVFQLSRLEKLWNSICWKEQPGDLFWSGVGTVFYFCCILMGGWW